MEEELIDQNNKRIENHNEESTNLTEGTSNNNIFDESSDEDIDIEQLCNSSDLPIDSEKPSLIPNESRFNAVEYLVGSLNSALDSLAFDKAIVIQSKMAGEINNSSSEVLKSIKETEDLLKENILKYNKLKNVILPGIEANLSKNAKTAKKITTYMKELYPVEYSKGRSKVLDNLTEDEEGLYS